MTLGGRLDSLHGGRAWMTNVALCALGAVMVMLARQFVAEHARFEIGFSGVAGWSAWVYVAAVMVVMTQPVNRWTAWIVVGIAVALRLAVVRAEPFLSSDIYRYVWDGVVQHAGVNPYRYVPGDAALSYLRGPHQVVFDNINRRDYARTIYPPVAQMIYWCVTLLSPTVTAMKVAMVGFEGVTVAGLMWLLRAMKRPVAEVLLYAWCPLAVWEVGGSGHVDAAVMAFVVVALVFRYREWPVLTGVFLGLAVMTKFYPLVLLPALWMRREGKLGEWRMPAAMIAVVAAGYAVYASAGKLVAGFLFDYTKEEGIDSGSRFFALDAVHRVPGLSGVPTGAFYLLAAVVMGGLSWWGWKVSVVGGLRVVWAHSSAKVRRMNGAPEWLKVAMGLAGALMLLFSPHYPWYVLWLVPFFVLTPSLWLLVYLMGMFYLLTTPLGDGTSARMFVLNEILYGAVGVAAVVGWAMGRWDLWRWVDLRREAKTLD
ncbi:MAG: glycosyltransferase family 87 protein [Acidobacteriota bacterium]